MSANVRGAWNEFLDSMKSEQQMTPNERTRLSDSDVEGWDGALDARTYSRLPLRTREDVRKAIFRMNPIKYRQVMGDYRWLQRKMKKLGLNPEDARYLF